MTFGLDSDGFTRKRLPDIESELITAFEAAYGPINQNEDGILRQLIGIMAERDSTLWELAEAVYLALFPSSSEGAQLDNVAELSGITRIAAAKSTAVIAAFGNQGASIAAATQVSSSNTGDVFQTDAIATITNVDAVRVDIIVDGVVDSTLYRITIDGNNFDYVSGIGTTANLIRNNLKAAVNAGSLAITAYDGPTTAELYVQSDDGETGYNVTVSTGGGGASLTITDRASPIPVTALTTGPNLVNAGQIDTIVTPVVGLDSVTNLADGDQGRDVETDAALRVRIGQVRLGAATVEAIRSRLQDEVSGVSAVLIVENRTDVPVGGQPAHSIEVIVQGGADQEVADKIWELKPAGIETFGTTSETVVDGAGQNQTVYFSRPTLVFGWVRIRYTVNPEESIAAGVDATLQQEILDYGNTFQIGDDMLWQRFLSQVVLTSGIKSAVVELDHTATAGGPPSYATDTDVAVDADELVSFDLTRIDVAEAP